MGSIFNLSGIDYNIAGGGFRCVLLSGKALSIEGVRLLTHFEGEEIRFRLKAGALIVAGKDLKLTALAKGFASVAGTITSLTVAGS